MPLLIIDAYALEAMRPGERPVAAATMEALVIPDFIEWFILLGDNTGMKQWLEAHRNGLGTLATQFSVALEDRATAWLRSREEGRPNPKLEWELLTIWAAAWIVMEVHAERLSPDRYDVLAEQADAVRLLAHVGVRTIRGCDVARA